jgi:hypothetical protein
VDRDTHDDLRDLKERHDRGQDRVNRVLRETDAINTSLREALEAYRKGDRRIDDYRRSR